MKITLSLLILILSKNLFAQSFSPNQLDFSKIDRKEFNLDKKKEFDGSTKFSLLNKIKENIILLPAKDSKSAQRLWNARDTTDILNGTVLNTSSTSNTVVVDLITDFLGPARVSLATSVSATDSTTRSNINIESFIAGGGTAMINSTLIGPTYNFKDNKSYLSLAFNPKLNFNFSTVKTSPAPQNINTDIGIELKLNLCLANGNIGIVGNYRIGTVYGSENFYTSLGISNRSLFTYSNLSLGFSVPSIMQPSYTQI